MKPLSLIMLLLALQTSLAMANGNEEHGKLLYEVYCSQCHGVHGNGKGINAASMPVAPRDHTDTTEMSARSDDDLFKAIQQGGKAVNKSVLMPAWGHNLSDDDIHDLISHLRVLCCQN